MYTRFRLVPKSTTLDDLWVRFKVIDSINAAKMTKYGLVMTPTPCTVDVCMISIRHSCTYLLTYLFTQLLGGIKPAISPKRLKIDRKLLLTAYIKSYTGFRLSPKCMTLNDLCVRFKNAAKMVKYSLVMTPTPCRVAGCIISVISSLLTPIQVDDLPGYVYSP